jgi:predicted nucleotidyltransferase
MDIYNNNDDWIYIKKKNYIRKNIIKKDISFDEIKDTILNNILLYKPYAIYIYGSRANGKNKIDSDVDIMVFWKNKSPEIDTLKYIKSNLVNILKIRVDFVNMIYTNKYIKKYNQEDILYFNNVILNCKSIYNSDNININNLIDNSYKLYKL